MATALGYDSLFDARGYRAFLDALMADGGRPADPVEKMMLEQLALAHFRVGQLHAAAGGGQGAEAQKLLNGAAARMLGEFRRTALALAAYRGRSSESGGASRPAVELLKAAQ